MIKQRRSILPLAAHLVLAACLAGPAGAAPFDLPGGDFPDFPTRQPTPEWLSSPAMAIASIKQARPGQDFHVAIVLELADEWYYDSPVPGPVALKAELDVKAPGLTVGEVLWPPHKPHQTTVGGKTITSNIYAGKTIIYVPLAVPAGARPGAYSVALTPAGQVCNDRLAKCVPLRMGEPVTATVAVQVGDASIPNEKWPQVAAGLETARTAAQLAQSPPGANAIPPASLQWDAAGFTILTGLGMALLAGLILNVMPCVLPVIPLKVLGIVQMAGESRRRFLVLGLAFAGGIMLFFAGIAAANIVLRLATSQALNWGEHFQNTNFRIGMALLLVALAANMFGLFTVTIPSRLANMGSDDPGWGQRHGVMSSIGSGVMAAILSTPCSFGILTAAFAWAQVSPLWLGTLAIMTIGLGMAIPYVLLIAFPGLVKRLPKPGRWMEHFRKSMGFVLIIVSIWLVGTTSDYSYPAWIIAYGAVLVFCLWAWGAWVKYDSPLVHKITIRGLAAMLAVLAGIFMLRPPAPLATPFQPFDRARIDSAVAGGQIVLIDFTANWCVNCKMVEKLIYDDSGVADQLRKRNIMVIKGDITTSDLPANEMLKELKEPGVPVTVIFPPGGADPIRLRGIFSKKDLLAALDQARK